MAFILLSYGSIVLLELILTQNLISSILFLLTLLLFIFQLKIMTKSFTSIMLLAFTTKLFVVSFVMKLQSGQAISSNLDSPIDTAVAVFISVMICTVISTAFVRLSHINSRGFIKAKFLETDSKMYSYIFLLLGVFFEFMHSTLRPSLIEGEGTTGFGGFGNLVSIGYLGVILHIYYQKISGNVYLSFSKFLMVALILYSSISIYSNTKHQFITIIIAIFFSCWAFNLRIVTRKFLSLALLSLPIILLLSNLIHTTRTYEFRTANIYEKVAIISDLDVFRDEVNKDEFSGELFDNPLLDRLDMLRETDMVISGINQTGFVGYYPITDSFIKILPSAIVGEKNHYSTGDEILWDIREKSLGVVSRTTIGLLSSIYAITGMYGVIFIFPIVVALFLSVPVMLFGNSISGNIPVVFILVKYLLFFTEKTVEGLVLLIARDLPITIFEVFVIYCFVSVIKGKKIKDENTDYIYKR